MEAASAEARDRSWQDVPYMYGIPLPSQFQLCHSRPILTTPHGVTLGFRKERQKGGCIGRGQGAIVSRHTLYVWNPLVIPIPTVPSPSDSDDPPWSYPRLWEKEEKGRMHRQRPGSGRGRTYPTCMESPCYPKSNCAIPVRF
jgi:hypothetical protein